MPITPIGFAHVRLTVTDIARSREFYERVFDLKVAFELPPDASEETKQQLGFLYGGVIYHVGEALLGLRPVADDSFSENRVGLDHVSFSLVDHAAIVAAATSLDELGIAHEPVKDIGAGYILEFRDPDGIALEVFAAKSDDDSPAATDESESPRELADELEETLKTAHERAHAALDSRETVLGTL